MKPQTIQISETYSASTCSPNTNFSQSKAGSCVGNAPVIIHTIPIVIYPMPDIHNIECFFPVVTALSPTDIRPHPPCVWPTKKKTVCVIGERRRCEFRTSHLSSLYGVFFLRYRYLLCKYLLFGYLGPRTCRFCRLCQFHLPLLPLICHLFATFCQGLF